MKGFSVALLFGLVAFASAYPKDRCMCRLEMLPLCASNGVTYGNECEFNCDKQKEFNKDLTILHDGQCEEDTNENLAQPEDNCICTKVFLPICGSDGATYSNQCVFQCNQKKNQDLKIVHDGQCKEKTIEKLPEDVCICTKELLPVCGSDDVTYSNRCTFECTKKKKKDLRISHEGQCEEKTIEKLAQPKDICFCTLDFLPVCGSDGVTYSNACSFQCNQKKNKDLKILHDGECEEKTVKNLDLPKGGCSCTKEFLPVCGSDGETYYNQCSFRCNQNVNQDLRILHDGQCEKKKTENVQPNDVCICTKEFTPVCGSDGVTYSNQCSFRCNQKKSPNQDLKIVHDGQCEEKSKNDCVCTKEFLPVCGSDGVTYSNQCSFQCSKKKSDNQDMYIDHIGSC